MSHVMFSKENHNNLLVKQRTTQFSVSLLIYQGIDPNCLRDRANVFSIQRQQKGIFMFIWVT